MRNLPRLFFILLFALLTLTLLWSNPQSPPPPSETTLAEKREPASIPTPSGSPISSQTTLESTVAETRKLDPWAARLKVQKTINARAPSALGKYSEVPSLKAVGLKSYHPRMGPEVSRQSGYVIFERGRDEETLRRFDGTHLPVVVDPRRPVYGVVDGQTAVVFKQYPADLQHFAATHGLIVVHEAAHIKTAFFTAGRFPADLIQILSDLSQQAEVKSAELSITFGKRRPL